MKRVIVLKAKSTRALHNTEAVSLYTLLPWQPGDMVCSLTLEQTDAFVRQPGGYGHHSSWMWPKQISNDASESPALIQLALLRHSCTHVYHCVRHRYNPTHTCPNRKTSKHIHTSRCLLLVYIWKGGVKIYSLNKPNSVLFCNIRDLSHTDM